MLEKEGGPILAQVASEAIGKFVTTPIAKQFFGSKVAMPVYHYTNFHHFLSIIQQNTVLASNIRFMNDNEEITHGKKILRLTSEKILQTAPLHQEKKILDNIIANVDLPPTVELFATCFCDDGNLLSQWNSYGVRGAGVAIGFDAYELKDALGSSLGNIQVSKVVYEQSDQVNIFETFLRLFFDGLKGAIPINIRQHPNFNDFAAGFIDGYVGSTLAVMKNSEFRTERELRLLINEGKTWARFPRRYRATDRLIIPALELTPANQRKLPIKEIVVGPTSDRILICEAVREVLARYEFNDVSVRHSMTPLRPV